MILSTNDTHAFDQPWSGGPGKFSVGGTWDGATAKLAYKDGGNWLPFGDNASFTENGGCRFEANAGDVLGVIVSGVGTTSLNAEVAPLTLTERVK